MKVLCVAAEGVPFIKVGGLGDVIGSLPQALQKEGVETRVMLPLYDTIAYETRQMMRFIKWIRVPLAWRQCYAGLFELKREGVVYYFIDNEYFFKRGQVYGAFDDAERFAFFSKAALEMIQHIDFVPDVIHCNDWHTALVPVYLNAFYREHALYRTMKSVLSIHNIAFQGKYDPYILGNIFGMDEKEKEVLMYDGCLNILKAGIEAADSVTTVSETYAQEIRTPAFSCGLHHILKARAYKLKGILNGIDTHLFNPSTDACIAMHYSEGSLDAKSANKAQLQQQLGLEVDPDKPLIGMVTRLTDQKGMDLLATAMDELVKLPIQLVVLGTGYPHYEAMMRHYEGKYHHNVRAVLLFSTAYASQVYAGSDMFLMPSKFEPCGLSQMIAMRYGSIPIVHAVGGLKDTIEAYDKTQQTGNGVCFQSYDAWDMLDAIKRALQLYTDKEAWEILQRNAMLTDWSWDNSAKKYKDLYRQLLD